MRPIGRACGEEVIGPAGTGGVAGAVCEGGRFVGTGGAETDGGCAWELLRLKAINAVMAIAASMSNFLLIFIVNFRFSKPIGKNSIRKEHTGRQGLYATAEVTR
jgi:hypothetical protein